MIMIRSYRQTVQIVELLVERMSTFSSFYHKFINVHGYFILVYVICYIIFDHVFYIYRSAAQKGKYIIARTTN